MKQLNDTMTPEIREQLRAFFAGLESTGSQYAPPIGHFQPDLILSADQDEDRGAFNPSLASQEPSIGHYPADILFTDELDPVGRPDDHYYIAQGQQVPPEAATKPLEGEQRAGLVVTALCLFVAAGLVVVGVLAFIILFWPWVNECYVRVGRC